MLDEVDNELDEVKKGKEKADQEIATLKGEYWLGSHLAWGGGGVKAALFINIEIKVAQQFCTVLHYVECCQQEI